MYGVCYNVKDLGNFSWKLNGNVCFFWLEYLEFFLEVVYLFCFSFDKLVYLEKNIKNDESFWLVGLI